MLRELGLRLAFGSRIGMEPELEVVYMGIGAVLGRQAEEELRRVAVVDRGSVVVVGRPKGNVLANVHWYITFAAQWLLPE